MQMSNVSLRQHNFKQLNLSIQKAYVYFKTSLHDYSLFHLKKMYMCFSPLPTASVRDIRDHWNLRVFPCQIYHIRKPSMLNLCMEKIPKRALSILTVKIYEWGLTFM